MADGGAFIPMTSFTPSKDSQREFRTALGRYSTGVTVVTCRTARGPLGITANSFASVSLDPPLVLWSPARASRRFPAFEAAEAYAIHVLGRDQEDLCRRFSGDGFDFGGLDWREAATGVPLIENCLARFVCRREAIHDGGDHAIIVGRVTEAEHRDGPPLLFSGGRYGCFTDGA